MHRRRLQRELEAMMTVRSLVLVALVGALSFGHVSESYAITSCNVCADEVHPCSFPCFISSPSGDNLTKTTCKGAGYKCLKVLPVTDEACEAPASTVAAAEASDATEAVNASVAVNVLTLAAAWLRDGLALVTGIVERVASLEGDAGVWLAHS
jgi:hypothetical protein